MVEATSGDPLLAKRLTTLMSIVAAGLLVALKLGVGLATGSLGLVSAGIDSSGDVVAAVLTFFAVRLGARPADPGHPYGHRRAENLGALGEAGILAIGGAIVCFEGISRLIGAGNNVQTRWFQFAVLGVALAVDLSRTVVSLRAARRYDSPALRSNGYHFAADMAGSLAVLAGLLAVRWGFAQGDSVAALLVAAMVLVTALRLVSENANVLMDRAPVQAREEAARAIAGLGVDIELNRLRLRESAGRYFADVVVSVPPGQALVEGHRAADLIEAAVERALPGSDVVVHVEPRRDGVKLRDRVLAIALAEPLVTEAHDIMVFEQQGSVSVSLHLKFPADLDLQAAHEVAERVERDVRGQLGVADAQTHLEPLERPLTAGPSDERADAQALRAVQRLVDARPRLRLVGTKLLATDAGRVVFVTVSINSGSSLADAHELAGELEEELRQHIPGIADVVVHTEP